MTDRVAEISPRGLQLAQAARYVGVGVTKFLEIVADGRMPKPRALDRRRLWDRRELDAAIDALPHDGEDDESENPWDGVAG